MKLSICVSDTASSVLRSKSSSRSSAFAQPATETAKASAMIARSERITRSTNLILVDRSEVATVVALRVIAADEILAVGQRVFALDVRRRQTQRLRQRKSIEHLEAVDP